MGAKTWMLVYADGNARDALSARPSLDRDRTQSLANSLFPHEKLELLGEGDLAFSCPPDNELHIGCFPGVAVVAAREFGLDHPSRLDPRFIEAGHNRTVVLHAMHSVVDWMAFAKWENGKLIRALSVSPDNGIIENIGIPLPFESPFWAGQFPAGGDSADGKDAYPLPFHPLDLGEAALLDFFGYQLEGSQDAVLFDPEVIPLIKYKRVLRPWWKFWRE